MSFNKLQLIIYSSGTTIDYRLTDLIKDHIGLNFKTIYPGGLYSTCDFFIPCDSTLPHPTAGAKRLEIFNGLKTVWEGQIDVFSPCKTGLNVEATGYWGAFVDRLRWDKIWCDIRITDEKWRWGNELDQFRVARQDAITIFPRDSDFNAGDDGRIIYTFPTNKTLSHITYTGELYKGSPTAENWRIYAYDVTNSGTITGTLGTVSGTVSYDGTPAAGCQQVALIFEAGTVQTADIDNGAYGKFSSVKVYGELGNINPTEVYKDIVEKFTSTFNGDESYIGSNTLSVEPCYMEWNTTAKNFMEHIAANGDASFNSWSVGLRESSIAGTPNGYPVLYYEQYPSLTDYDYVIRVEDIIGDVTFDHSFDEIWNYISVKYRDENDWNVYKCDYDDAGLTDATSSSTYGNRMQFLDLGNAGSADALNYAKRYLAWFKDPKWRMANPIKIKGLIRTKQRNKVPVCWIQAGKRIMVENYLQEIRGAGIIFLITETSFDEETEMLTLKAGTPDPLAVMAAQIKK